MLRRFFPTPTDDAPDDTDATPSAGAPGARYRPANRAWPRSRSPASPGGGWRSCSARCSSRWIVIVFARQVSEAAAATGRAEAMIVVERPASTTEVAGLERELERIGDRRYVLQQARGYGLGGPHEIAFSLAAGAPSLPPDAPGSALGPPRRRDLGQPARALADAAVRPRCD